MAEGVLVEEGQDLVDERVRQRDVPNRPDGAAGHIDEGEPQGDPGGRLGSVARPHGRASPTPVPVDATLVSPGCGMLMAAIDRPSGAQKNVTTDASSKVRTAPLDGSMARSGPIGRSADAPPRSGAVNASVSPAGSNSNAGAPKTGDLVARRSVAGLHH